MFGKENDFIFCDLSGEVLRPFVPASLRDRVFRLLHSSAHPGAKVTDRIIRKRYVWPNMHKDISRFCKNCLECQRSKVSRHVGLIPSQIVAPESRFLHVHMDIVGPLPVDSGFRYCLTIIDRFSRWPEAIPMQNIEASTVIRAFMDNWVSRFGSPETITTDQGSQFESSLFQGLLKLIGCQRIRSTPYHPASNGIIERWHRTFKAALMCHATREWTRVLPTVLLGLRSNVLDCGSSPAEFLYGTTIRIPGEFVVNDDFSPDPQVFLEEFRELMRRVKPIPVEHRHKNRAFVFKDLYTCSHVFLRAGHIKKSLEPPYSGPHRIIERNSDRVFQIDVNGSSRNVSVELLKPAYFAREAENNVNNLSTNISVKKGPSISTEKQTPLVHPDVAPTLVSDPENFNFKKPAILRTYSRKKKVNFKV